MRVGVIGFGRQGKRRADALLALNCEVLVYDTVPLAGCPYQTVGSLRELNGVNAVCVCVPTTKHFRVASELMSLGHKRLLLEKPLTNDVVTARELLAIAKQSRVSLYCGLNMRYRSPVMKAAELMPSIGHVALARGQIGHSQFIRAGERLRHSGGPLFDSGTHILDIILLLLGRPKRLETEHVTQENLISNACIRVLSETGDTSISVCASFRDWRPSGRVASLIEFHGTEGSLRIDLGYSGDFCELVTEKGQERFDFAYPDQCWKLDCEAFLRGEDNSAEAMQLMEVLG